jgi:hypothetical protein
VNDLLEIIHYVYLSGFMPKHEQLMWVIRGLIEGMREGGEMERGEGMWSWIVVDRETTKEVLKVLSYWVSGKATKRFTVEEVAKTCP